MSESHFDLIVFGTGPAGSTVARKAAGQGRKVAIVESRQFGGTCALRGCNPKKVYTNAGSLIDGIRRSDGKLIRDAGATIDWEDLLAFKRNFTEPVAKKSEQSFSNDGITTLAGQAQFTGTSQITVDGKSYSADRFLIATGASPVKLSIPGEKEITTSDEFLELENIPNRVVFVGGGYVSMEFAHVVARCGKKVTVVQRGDRILPEFDPDLVDILTRHSQQQGIQFRLDCDVTAITRNSGGSLRIGLSSGDSIDCDLAVHGAGRVPNIEPLCLSAAEVQHDSHGITVDRFLRSPTNPRVFAAGDCAASHVPRLTPVANEEARIVVKNLFAETPDATPEYGTVPKVAFTTPSIASAGLSEREAADRDGDCQVRMEETTSWTNVRKTGRTAAAYKLLIDKNSGQIVGAHLLGPAAEETINLFALAMRFQLTAKDLKSTLFAFPTFASDVRQMV